MQKLVSDFSKLSLKKTAKGKTQEASFDQSVMVEKILVSNGFCKLEKETYRKTLEIKEGLFFVSQPNGSQRFPDYLLFKTTKTSIIELEFELKKGHGKIMWNDGFPKKDSLYLFSDTSTGRSHLFTGAHVSLDTRKKYLQDRELIKNLNKTKSMGDFSFTYRQAISQSFRTNKNDLKYSLDLIRQLYESN